jgi:hypothetical protein
MYHTRRCDERAITGMGAVSREWRRMAVNRGETQVPWPMAVASLIESLPETFMLAEVYALAESLGRAFPNNKHIQAKIRQSLQTLRDRGHLAFVGGGRYAKIVPVPPKSVLLDFGAAARFSSGSQIARVAVEAWAARNVVCRRCASPLVLVPPNAKLLDALCRAQHHEVQIKGLARAATDRLTASAFAPIAERLAFGRLPDFSSSRTIANANS